MAAAARQVHDPENALWAVLRPRALTRRTLVTPVSAPSVRHLAQRRDGVATFSCPFAQRRDGVATFPAPSAYNGRVPAESTHATYAGRLAAASTSITTNSGSS